ncbi:MAG: sigma-70 family RNA polymerase sigma factor [Kiritimatiellae bacterium]|nr:sigma-70 family RNA polymerase sigma factor [Kiritimatiellia bacterium]
MLSRKQKIRVEVFVTRLTEAQFDLHSYITYLLGNITDAYDVLQETNLILWQKAKTYDAAKPFLAWARSIAYFQALKFRKSRSRERLVFDNDLLETVAARAEDETGHQHLLDKMELCFERLSPEQRAVMFAKYQEGDSLAVIAEKMGCSVASVGMLLMRIRRKLAKCIREAVAREATA